MRHSIGSMTALAVAFSFAAGACAQQVEQAPLPPMTGVSVPPTTGVSEPPPAAAAAPPSASTTAPRQVAVQPLTSLTTQDCVRMPTPAEQTDCLNQVASDGNYMPSPKPAPGSQAPMAYRLPLGKRQTSPP